MKGMALAGLLAVMFLLTAVGVFLVLQTQTAKADQGKMRQTCSLVIQDGMSCQLCKTSEGDDHYRGRLGQPERRAGRPTEHYAYRDCKPLTERRGSAFD